MKILLKSNDAITRDLTVSCMPTAAYRCLPQLSIPHLTPEHQSDICQFLMSVNTMSHKPWSLTSAKESILLIHILQKNPKEITPISIISKSHLNSLKF